MPQHSHRSCSPGWLSLHPGRIPPRQWRATSTRTVTREQLSRWHSHAGGPEDWHVFLDPGVRGHMLRGHLEKGSSYNPIAIAGYLKVLRAGQERQGWRTGWTRGQQNTQNTTAAESPFCVQIGSFICLLVETGSHCASPGWTATQRPACFCLPGAEIKGAHPAMWQILACASDWAHDPPASTSRES